jgi:hypothetical protein
MMPPHLARIQLNECGIAMSHNSLAKFPACPASPSARAPCVVAISIARPADIVEFVAMSCRSLQ